MSGFISQNGLPSDLFTSGTEGVRRIAVDSQQTSFEALEQFQYLDRLIDIPSNQQIVYYITLTNPLVLFKRELNLFTGGREYLAYPDTGTHTFSGTLEDSGLIGPVSTIPNPDVDPVPTTGVTIQRATGVGIFTPDATVLPTALGLVVSQGNINQAASAYQADEDRVGVGGGVSFYIVMNPLGGANDVRGQYILKWEERFND